jgi:PIN domain nuclease of toxin-antitoxin system
MIVLDTHIWVWWVHGDAQLTADHARIIQAEESNGIGVSAISSWEVAKLVELNKLVLPCPIKDWFLKALSLSGIRLLELTPDIAVESTQLPAPFHKDPADQIIVATARLQNCPLITLDQRIRSYPHVTTP